MDESPFTPFGSETLVLQSGITRFRSQEIKTREPLARVAVAGAIFGNHEQGPFHPDRERSEDTAGATASGMTPHATLRDALRASDGLPGRLRYLHS
jgi:hypothetical protein